MPSPSTSHRLIDHLTRDARKLALLALADRAQGGKRFLGRSSVAADQDPDGLVDHRPRGQTRPQLLDHPPGLRQDLSVVHGHRGRHGEPFTEFDGVLIEHVLAVGIDVDCPDDERRVAAAGATARCAHPTGRREDRTEATAPRRPASPTGTCGPRWPR